MKLFSVVALAALLFAGCATRPAASTSANRIPPPGGLLSGPPINRFALVSRHNPVLHSFDTGSPLSVGNGEFCFTADATGLQTFPSAYDIPSAIPLCTMADWGWHSFPNPQGFSMANFAYKNYDSHGREVGYADQLRNNASSDYLRENPHKFNLGQIGFLLTKSDGSPAQPADISNITQTLDLWNGTLISHFQFDGQSVDVETVCASPSEGDSLAVHVTSPLLASGHLRFQLRFPYASPGKNGSDWTKPDAHSTKMLQLGDLLTGGSFSDGPPRGVEIFRQLDDTKYSVSIVCPAKAVIQQTAEHQIEISPTGGASSFACMVGFNRDSSAPNALSPFADTKARSTKHWNTFWSTGGAIDLSLSKDPRWSELERRIVLSEYLTAIQSAGKNPPAETGLTSNSWYGRFHMEMYWWHDAHFALWGRTSLLENNMGFYQRALPQAQANAQRQGYTGARWPKMSEPTGADSPSSVGAFLIWEQPHPIYLAELIYRDHPDPATLAAYRDVVFQTADFMASFAYWDAATKRYVLGPPLQEAQERYDKATMFNPTYELVYWRWALTVAQEWRTRLGLPRDPKWDDVLDHLSLLPVADGKYLFTESTPDSFTNPKWVTDHPAVVNALGVLPGPTVDPVIMRNTLNWIWQNWNWPDTWGWDYPALAMCAARVGEPDRAVDALLLDTPKNHYMADGHVFQRAPDLPLYLPANGGLLTAVAMMAAGWDGAPHRHAPGFPDNGQWTVRWEKLRPLP